MDGGSRGKDGRSEERMGGAGETTGGEVVHIKNTVCQQDAGGAYLKNLRVLSLKD